MRKMKWKKKILALTFLLFSILTIFFTANSVEAKSHQYKTKSFYLYNLGNDTSVQIKAIRDKDKYTVWGWNNTGVKGSINVHNFGGGTCRIYMSRPNVTD